MAQDRVLAEVVRQTRGRGAYGVHVRLSLESKQHYGERRLSAISCVCLGVCDDIERVPPVFDYSCESETISPLLREGTSVRLQNCESYICRFFVYCRASTPMWS